MGFKIGDAVRVVRMDVRDIGTPVKLGDRGVVSDIVNNDIGLVLVKFPFVLPQDHAVVTCGKWRAVVDQIEVVGPVTVKSALRDYTAACEQFEAAELALEKAKAAVQDARLNLRDALDGEA